MKTIYTTLILLLFVSPALAEDRPKLSISNATPQAVEVFWLAPDGERVSYGKIEPEGNRVILTTLGHRFVVVHGEHETEIVCKVPVTREVIRAGSAPHVDKTKPAESAPESGVRFDPVLREIEGWKVHIDPALLEGENRQEGTQALTMLANHLQRIAILVPADRLAKLREMEIWIELSHPTLTNKQYHPSRQWLINNGHDPRLERKVHIPQATALLSRDQLLKHPAVILHELAHAYHDQVLGFDHPEIRATYEMAKAAGIYENVLSHTGRMVRHYGLSNHKEYFAEATEAFFYRNDFYPFVRAELKEHDPRLHDLLVKIWEADE